MRTWIVFAFIGLIVAVAIPGEAEVAADTSNKTDEALKGLTRRELLKALTWVNQQILSHRRMVRSLTRLQQRGLLLESDRVILESFGRQLKTLDTMKQSIKKTIKEVRNTPKDESSAWLSELQKILNEKSQSTTDDDDGTEKDKTDQGTGTANDGDDKKDQGTGTADDEDDNKDQGTGTANDGADKNDQNTGTANDGADKNDQNTGTANHGADKNAHNTGTANDGDDKKDQGTDTADDGDDNKDQNTGTANHGADKNDQNTGTANDGDDKKDQGTGTANDGDDKKDQGTGTANDGDDNKDQVRFVHLLFQ